MPSYSYDGPDVSAKDTVRFLLQDTVSSDWLLSDEEISYALNRWMPVHGTYEFVAAVLADNLAARYAREASYSADGVSINLAQVAQQFRDLSANLREQHRDSLVGAGPDVGGVSPYEGLPHDVKPFAFGTGMHDDKAAGRQDYGSQDFPTYYPEENPGV